MIDEESLNDNDNEVPQKYFDSNQTEEDQDMREEVEDVDCIYL